MGGLGRRIVENLRPAWWYQASKGYTARPYPKMLKEGEEGEERETVNPFVF